MTVQFGITWNPVDEPEPPVGLIAPRATSSRPVIERLLRLPKDARARLSGLTTDDDVVLLGPTQALPWADGVIWLVRPVRDVALFIPAMWRPLLRSASHESGSLSLLDRVVRSTYEPGGGPLVLWRRCDGTSRLLSMANARPPTSDDWLREVLSQ